MLSLALQRVPNLTTITPIVLLYQSSEIQVTVKAGWNAVLRSDTLLQLMLISLHTTSSETLLESSRDNNTLYRWITRKSADLYCQQLSGSIFALGSALPYKESGCAICSTYPELVVCRLKWSTWCQQAPGLSHLEVCICTRVVSNICLISEGKETHYSRNGEHLLVWWLHIGRYC
jgi:hypothetical protein